MSVLDMLAWFDGRSLLLIFVLWVAGMAVWIARGPSSS